MWTPATRRQHSRAGLRYETDLTDAEWAVIAPLMPEPALCGRPATWTTREILNAIFYVLRGGIAWRLIPKDLPPKSTAFGYFSRWRDEGLFGATRQVPLRLAWSLFVRAISLCTGAPGSDGAEAKDARDESDHSGHQAVQARRGP